MENTKEIQSLTDSEIMEIAASSALSVEGVSGMSNTLTDSLKNNIPRLNFSSTKGVKLDTDDNELIIDLYINVKYKVKIPQLAWDIQSVVKKNVEDKIDRKVKEVNIHVQGVDIPEEETK